MASSLKEREYGGQNGRHDEACNQCTALKLRVQFGEPARTVLDGLAVAALVGQDMDDLRHVIATILHHRSLADDHVAFLDLAGEQAVQIGQQRADHNADEEGDRHEQ